MMSTRTVSKDPTKRPTTSAGERTGGESHLNVKAKAAVVKTTMKATTATGETSEQKMFRKEPKAVTPHITQNNKNLPKELAVGTDSAQTASTSPSKQKAKAAISAASPTSNQRRIIFPAHYLGSPSSSGGSAASTKRDTDKSVTRIAPRTEAAGPRRSSSAATTYTYATAPTLTTSKDTNRTQENTSKKPLPILKHSLNKAKQSSSTKPLHLPLARVEETCSIRKEKDAAKLIAKDLDQSHKQEHKPKAAASQPIRKSNSDNNFVSSNEEQRQRSIKGSSQTQQGRKSPEFSKIRSGVSRHLSIENAPKREKTIKFDPRVWVYEYQRSPAEQQSEQAGDTWFTSNELERFKMEAIARIQKSRYKQFYMPSGTGRVVRVHNANGTAASKDRKKAFFTDPALSHDGEDHDDDITDHPPRSPPSALQTVKEVTSPTSSPESSFDSADKHNIISPKLLQQIIQSEIKTVLIVDKYDIFLGLFTRALKSMLPHVQVSVAHTAEEAVQIIDQARLVTRPEDGGATHGFDMIIVEEQLNAAVDNASGSGQSSGEVQQDKNTTASPMSGSDLIRCIAKEEKIMDAAASAVAKSSSSSPFSANWGLWGFQRRNNQNESSIKAAKPRFPLLIGVSANLKQYGDTLKQAGSNFVWGKPPPAMNGRLRDQLLFALLQKRGKDVDTYLA